MLDQAEQSLGPLVLIDNRNLRILRAHHRLPPLKDRTPLFRNTLFRMLDKSVPNQVPERE